MHGGNRCRQVKSKVSLGRKAEMEGRREHPHLGGARQPGGRERKGEEEEEASSDKKEAAKEAGTSSCAASKNRHYVPKGVLPVTS